MKWSYEAKQNIEKCGPIECQIVPESGSVTFLQNSGNHSPEGFQIGYEGSGPADLAYSILSDYFTETTQLNLGEIKDKAEVLHQEFKRTFVARSRESFEISSDTIEAWLNTQESN